MSPPDIDVLIIGGGPAGACSALYLAKRGLKVRILEKDRFPRFHVGESLLPSLNPLFDELGLTEPLSKVTRVPKNGAEVAMAWQDSGAQLNFAEGQPWGHASSFNVERAVFDKVLLDHAAAQPNVEIRQDTAVTGIEHLRDNDCRLMTTDGPMDARLVLDCSGQATVLGRLLGSKQVIPGHRKIAFMGHFKGAQRLTGESSGFISVVMADDAWFWFIPIDEERTSIGMVMDKDSINQMRRQGVKPGQELAWALPRTPCLAKRLQNATYPESNGCVSDFSYHCSPGADAGYLMVGDAEAFLDPVFSSGLYLAVAGARDATQAAAKILNGDDAPAARKAYLEQVAERRKFFFHYIKLFYSHAFREFLIEGKGPLGIHRALIAVLSGRCERLPLSMRWRLGLLNFMHRIQKRTPTILRPKEGWSIIENRKTPRDRAMGNAAATRVSAPQVPPGTINSSP
jgi:flavin-dependent dehydrogenase